MALTLRCRSALVIRVVEVLWRCARSARLRWAFVVLGGIVAIACAHGAGQLAVGVSAAATAPAAAPPVPVESNPMDSLSGVDTPHLRAQLAVEEYELVARRYWPTEVNPCYAGVYQCAGGQCTWRTGHPPCLVGRLTPCPIAGSGDSGLCSQPTPSLANAFHLGKPPVLRDVIAARRFLTLMLDSLGRVVPDDPWIAGQRVYYLVALGNFDGALTAARECRAASAWCELLRGYAIQRSGHSIEAQTVFANAIAAMPAEDRCTWTDVSLLLDPETVRAYSAMPCESPERAAFEERFWMLADPSWLVSGNDRRAEHLARLVERNIQLDWSEAMHADTLRGPAAFATPPAALVLTGENDSWWIEGRPLYKLNPNPIPPDANLTKADSQRLQRCAAQECYHSGWTQASPGQVICAIGTEPVVRQRLAKSWKEPGSSWLQWTSNQQCARLRPVGVRYHFAPLAHALTTPFAASPADWDLNAGPPIDEILQPVLGKEETPLPERYTPLYAAHVTHIPSWQVAFFRRGDSAVVAGVFDVTSDSAFDHLLATSRRGANQAPPSRARWMAGLFVNARSVDAGAPFRQTLARLDGAPVARWAATAAAPWDSVLLGLELLTPNDSAHGGGVLARERFGVAPPSEPVQRVQLSDILMYAPGTDLPHALVGANGALGSAFGSTTVSGRRTVGLYWEAYGERSLETERVTLTVVQLARDQGVLGEVWSAVTRAGVAPPVDLNWTDQAPSVNPRDPLGNVGRAVTINIGGLESGRYAVRLTVAVDGQAPVAVTRTFSVRSP